MDSWKKHSVGELRIIAKAYKKHTKVGAVSKMKKGELIALLDKHLLIDDAGSIKVRATQEAALDVKKGDEPKTKKEKKAEKAEDPEVKTMMEKLKSSYAKMTDKKEKQKSPEPMSLAEEMALAEESSLPPKAMTQMMAAVADAMAIRSPEMPPKAMAQMLSAVADAMAIQAPEMKETVPEMTTKDLIQGLPQELQDKIFGFLPQKLKKDVNEGTKAEKKAKEEKASLKFIKEMRPKIKLTQSGVKDFVYSLMEVNGSFESGYYEIMEEMRDNILQYDLGDSSNWSEAKEMRMLEKAGDIAHKEMMTRFINVIKKANREKMNDEDFLKEVLTESATY